MIFGNFNFKTTLFNVCSIKFHSKHSTKTTLQNLMEQTLLKSCPIYEKAAKLGKASKDAS